MKFCVCTNGVLNHSNKQSKCVILVCLKYICVDFVTRIQFWVYVRPEDPRYNFYKKKKLRKNIYNEVFSFTHSFFPYKGFHINIGVFLYFVFFYCVIDHNSLETCNLKI